MPGGHDEEGSLIRRSRWATEDGIVESREAPAFPGDRGRAVLLRRGRAAEGPARVRVVLPPLGAYGTQSLREARRDDCGVWTARVGDLHPRWTGGGDVSCSEVGSTGAQFTFDLVLDAGQRHDLVLELGERQVSAAGLCAPSDPWSRTERSACGRRSGL
ncbi:hypothetical protein ACFWP7_37235 [Streptomyces sp. NPDC058470]|uniref:hypothetical protein n=1 Tax=Streptomyces sp. NPDC058470 TaxID=3346515 RepID=UPI003662B60B